MCVPILKSIGSECTDFEINRYKIDEVRKYEKNRVLTSEPEVVETSGWFQNVPCQNIYQKCRSPHDA